TVKNIEHESYWWYLACGKCEYPGKQQIVAEKDEYGEVYIHVYQQGAVKLLTLSIISLTLFDRQAYPILDKSTTELLQEVRKVT
ncbi:hypothetical protein Tco_1141663, partial [Tanacetum coccineum]